DVVTHFPKDLYIARVDTAAKSVSTVLHIRMQGSLRLTRGNCAPISPGGSRVAYINAVDDGTPWGTRILFAVDLDGHRETVITARADGIIVYDFDWIDDDRLLIRTCELVGGLSGISSWIYDLRGGR
ncbi:MAG: hypothetical protein RDU89_11455, partial [bacterium]|nr:hypothetical protein [bacterium]